MLFIDLVKKSKAIHTDNVVRYIYTGGNGDISQINFSLIYQTAKSTPLIGRMSIDRKFAQWQQRHHLCP
jgi:hypothetical protein